MTQAATSSAASTTAARPRAAVGLYVALTLVAAAACSAAAYSMDHEVAIGGLTAFVVLAAVTDLREVRLPVVGHVTLSFVPVLAALIVFGLWPAMVVATASGLATLTVTRDAQKVAFNVGDYVVSTFLAGLVYLTFLPPDPSFVQRVLPAFAATAADFLVNTIMLAGVLALASGGNAWRIWRANYQWGLPSYMTGRDPQPADRRGCTFGSACLGLSSACRRCFSSGTPTTSTPGACVIVLRTRARSRRSAKSSPRRCTRRTSCATRSAAWPPRSSGPAASRPTCCRSSAPDLAGLELAHRIEFMTEMGGDYFDFVPLPDGRLGLVCADVMGKGLAAALIMTMARSIIHAAARDGRRPGEVLVEVNDSLTRDLAGQSAPSFLTLAYAIYSPAERELVVANGGHNPLLVFGRDGDARVPVARQHARCARRPRVPRGPPATRARATGFALFTDGLTEARDPHRALFGTPAPGGGAARARRDRRPASARGGVAGRRRLPRRRARRRRRHAAARPGPAYRGNLTTSDRDGDEHAARTRSTATPPDPTRLESNPRPCRSCATTRAAARCDSHRGHARPTMPPRAPDPARHRSASRPQLHLSHGRR